MMKKYIVDPGDFRNLIKKINRESQLSLWELMVGVLFLIKMASRNVRFLLSKD